MKMSVQDVPQQGLLILYRNLNKVYIFGCTPVYPCCKAASQANDYPSSGCELGYNWDRDCVIEADLCLSLGSILAG